MTQDPAAESRGLLLIQPERDAYIAEFGEEAVAEYDGVLSYLSDLHTNRKRNAADIAAYNLPQLPEPDIDEVYEGLQERERLFSPRLTEADYDNGSATVPDELIVVEGLRKVIITAEHATTIMQPDPKTGVKTPREADYGTGSLALLIQEHTAQAAIAPLGRQTGNANGDPEHPIKDHIRSLLERDDTARVHLSLHGTGRTQVAALTDEKSYGILLGIGPEEEVTEETYAAVDIMRDVADKYDLRLGVNQQFIKFESDTPSRPMRLPDGSMKTIAFAAKGEHTTRSFSAITARKLGRPFVAIQIEMSDVIKLLPIDDRRYTSRDSQRNLSYLGYSFVRESVELLAALV